MNRVIYRNIALVSVIFIVAFSIMLTVNYFQVRDSTPLQTDIIETLKLINDDNANNPVLQEQIRQLDLMARKAYFVSHDRLMAGVYILLFMLAVFIVCARGYYAGQKDIPDKVLDPFDEWAIKTKVRKYVVWGTSVVAATALVFAFLSSPRLKNTTTKQTVIQPEMALLEQQETEELTENATYETQTDAIPQDDNAKPENTETLAEEINAQEKPTVSKVTHSAFRGNNSNGISSAKNVPVKWNLKTGTNIAWRMDIPRKGFNSPVISGNKLFFTGADEDVRELFCYNLSNGKKLWSLTADNIPGSPATPPETTDDTGLAASGVATNGTYICAIFGTGDLMCADMNGKRIWAKNIGVPDNHYGYASSLLTLGNLLFVQYDNRVGKRVIAFDITTGAERWSKNRPDKDMSWSSPIIVYINNTPQLVLMGCPSITAYNPTNGEQLWRVESFMGEVCSSPCSANGIVFGASDHSKMVAINAADGSLIWDSYDVLPEVASPVAYGENIFVATTYGVVASFNAQTGELRVEHELGQGFYSSPIIAEGKIFLFSNDGKMHIFTADNEFKLLDSFDTGEEVYATPAFTDGMLVVRTQKSIYCVSVL